MIDVAVVLGTYNRLPLLAKALASFRRSCGGLNYHLIVVDGGSTDGTLAWLREETRVDLIQQGALLGAVKAFNAGFEVAVDYGAAFVAIINDDDELTGPLHEIEQCVDRMRGDASIGAVAFETDLRGPWACETWNGMPYCNKGVVRREAGMAAARAMGDPTGRAWWGHDHHTYAADTEMGLWLWRLGWTVEAGRGLRVHDHSPAMDALRLANVAEYTRPDGTHRLFHERWNKPSDAGYCRADAERFGGVLR